MVYIYKDKNISFHLSLFKLLFFLSVHLERTETARPVPIPIYKSTLLEWSWHTWMSCAGRLQNLPLVRFFFCIQNAYFCCLLGTSSCTSQRYLNSNNLKNKLWIFPLKFSSIISIHQLSHAEMSRSYQILTLLPFLTCSCSSDSYRFSHLDVASPHFIPFFLIPFLRVGLGSHCFFSGYFNGLLATYFPVPTTVLSN